MSNARPVAGTVLMLLNMILKEKSKEIEGTLFGRAEGYADNLTPCTSFFNNSTGAHAIVDEPFQSPGDYEGVLVSFHNTRTNEQKKYRGVEIANIAPDIFKFLAAK